MRFLSEPTTDLTYSDIFLVPSRSDVTSRLVWTWRRRRDRLHHPAGRREYDGSDRKRMAETMARRGGLAVLPQDVPLDVLRSVTAWVKARTPCSRRRSACGRRTR